jgi:hypothetical protein
MEKQEQFAGKHQSTMPQGKGGSTPERQEHLRRNAPAALRKSYGWNCFTGIVLGVKPSQALSNDTALHVENRVGRRHELDGAEGNFIAKNHQNFWCARRPFLSLVRMFLRKRTHFTEGGCRNG